MHAVIISFTALMLGKNLCQATQLTEEYITFEMLPKHECMKYAQMIIIREDFVDQPHFDFLLTTNPENSRVEQAAALECLVASYTIHASYGLSAR